MISPRAWLRWLLSSRIGIVLAATAVMSWGAVEFLALLQPQLESEALRQTDTQAQTIARSVGQGIAGALQIYDASLHTIARQMQVSGVASLPADTRQSLLFAGVPHDNSQFGFINVLNDKGEIVEDPSQRTPRLGPFAGRDYFTRQRESATDTLVLGDPFDKVDKGFSLISLSRRRSLPDGSFAGVVVGSIRTEYLSSLLAAADPGVNGTVTLLRDDGMILQRRPEEKTEIGRRPKSSPFVQLDPAMPANIVDPVDGVVRRTAIFRVDGLPLSVAVGLSPSPGVSAQAAILHKYLVLAVACGTLSTVGLSWAYWEVKRKEARDRQLRKDAANIVLTGDQKMAALEAIREQQERRSEILREVSHDLRAPLQGIIAYTDLMQQSGGLLPEQAQRLAVIRQEVAHMHGLADRTLDRVGQLQTAGRQLKSIDVRSIVLQCCASARALATQKNLLLNASIARELPDLVLSDPESLDAVLRNLLANSVAFTERGRIDVQVTYANHKMHIAVADTGIGMPADQVQRLRNPDDPETASRPRHGVGLSIIKRRTHQLGGSLGYQPTVGGGTTIIIELPAEPAPATDRQNAAAPGLRILLVEDSPSIRTQFADQLIEAGFLVTQANSGEQGLRCVEQEEFDVILTDIKMGRINGIEMARRIRASSVRCRNAPIIAVTAERPDGQIAMWREAGVTVYLQKPCQPHELLEAIRAVVTNRSGLERGRAA